MGEQSEDGGRSLVGLVLGASYGFKLFSYLIADDVPLIIRVRICDRGGKIFCGLR